MIEIAEGTTMTEVDVEEKERDIMIMDMGLPLIGEHEAAVESAIVGKT